MDYVFSADARPSVSSRDAVKFYLEHILSKNPMKPLMDCRLYTFVDTAYLNGRSVSELAMALCLGGADLIQLRAKNATKAEVEKMAWQILPITQAANVGLVINDHLDVARKIGADFCHLGQEDFFGAGYTRVQQLALGEPDARIGLSTHAPDQAMRAVAAQPAYVAIGPVYATATKPTALPVGLDYVRWAAENVTIPWFAIGGINFKTVEAVLATGAKRICVVSAILNAPDIAEACARMKNLLFERKP
jgi:thiamine-phosphate pyrophosphorylase